MIRAALILSLGLGASACSAGSSLSGSANTAGNGSAATSGSASSTGSDVPVEPATPPADVAGAYLVGCDPIAAAATASDETFGCALLASADRTRVAAVAGLSLTLTFADGTSATPAPQPSTTPEFDILITLPKGRYATITRCVAQATVAGAAVSASAATPVTLATDSDEATGESSSSDAASESGSTPVPGPAPDPGYAPQPNDVYLFLTKVTAEPVTDFTGLSGADALCDADAKSAGLATSDPSFQALLSSDTVDARSRIAGGRVVNVTGAVIAASVADLFLGSVPNIGLVLSADGSVPADPARRVWSGSSSTGNVGGTACNGWTSNAIGLSGLTGSVNAGTSGWFDSGDSTCNSGFRLYCFGHR